ncbi:hypothetical protein [Paraflavitalea speifideaquila]|uniref:hypothetical protein n=1 Tax=Paraflavitalea speifideaquila TaxID=3076558 RepID=UPI0028EC0CF7|nr:hypothetical protein [Paraflavitalea speifideiaquila]
MARFNCIPPVTGTIGPVCIYQMYGRYYLRTRSSLTGKRVKKDTAFRKTMMYAGLLAKASRIASAVYTAVPAHRKQHALYRKLTGEAMQWLKLQWQEKDIIEYLNHQYAQASVNIRPYKSTSLNPSYRNKTRHPLKKQGRQRPDLKHIPSVRPSFETLYYLHEYRKLRRRVNETISQYSWTEYVLTQ